MTVAEPSKSRAPAVLQVLPQLVTGGVERGTVDVSAALVAAGWKAVVASAGGPMVRELERIGAHHVALPLASKNPFVMHANIRRLADLIRREGIDVVHARSRAPAWSALFAARRTHCHFVTTFHNAYGGAESRWKRRYNAVMAEGERVIAISPFVGEHATEVYGVPAERLRVINRGIDIVRFDPDKMTPERVMQLARAWRLPDGVPVVMLPGRLTRWKGHGILLEALRLLGRPAVHCLIVGTGSPAYRRELIAQIVKQGQAERFQIIEDCRDMPAAYMLADVVVSASTLPEGFGRVIVEAQAMGRPVIATAHGGALGTIRPGETGWLVPPGEPQALARAIGEALDLGLEERMELGRRATAHVRAEFTAEVMTRRTLKVYEEILFPDAAAQGTAEDEAAA